MKGIPEYIPKGTKEQVVEQLKSWVDKKVKRGPTWDWGPQDEDSEGNEIEGKVCLIRWWDGTDDDTGRVLVMWENGSDRSYRVGNNYADVVLVNPGEVYNEVPAQTKTHLNMDEIIEAHKKGLKLRLTEEAFREYGNDEDRIVEIKHIDEPDGDGDYKIYFRGNRPWRFVNKEGKHYADKMPMFESVVEEIAEAPAEKPKYLGKAYAEADVQPGDKICIDGDAYEGVVVSGDEARIANKNISGDVDEWVYCRVEKQIKGTNFKVGHVSGWGYICVKKINSIEQQEVKQQEVKQQEKNVKQETKKESTMKEQVMSGLKALTEEGKEGFQSGAGAVGADEIVKLFHKHFDSKLPSWWGSVPMMKDLEATLVPGLLFLVATFANNKYAKKAEKLCLAAFRGKVHDLTKHLWADVRPLFEELSSLLEDE